MSRQKLVGWILVVVAVIYLAYFVKIRLFGTGPAITGKEWLQFAGMIIILMLGTANVRLAAMREQRQKSQQSQ